MLTWDRTALWTTPLDVWLGGEFVGKFQDPTVLEIGVWRGHWLLQTLVLASKANGVGIDPYPGSPEVRDEFVKSVETYGLKPRVTLVDSQTRVCEMLCTDADHVQFGVIHIDGVHTQKGVDNDLQFAQRHLRSDGIIIIDDYRHTHFPGIAAATFSFLAQHSFAMFMVTERKAYLVRKDAYPTTYQQTAKILSAAGLEWMHYADEHKPNGPDYIQESDVFGFPVLLCLGNANNDIILELFAGDKDSDTVRIRSERLKKLGRDWIPPRVMRALKAKRFGTRS